MKSEAQLQKEAQELLLTQQKAILIERLLAENSSKLLNVKNVIVNNGHFYRDPFLRHQLTPFLEGGPMKIEDFLERLDLVTKNFVNCTNTQNVYMSIQAVPSKPSFFFLQPTQDQTLDIVPVVHLFPVKRFFAKTGSSFGNSEGNGYISFQLRNFLRGGENLILDASIGSRTRTSYLANFNCPINNNAYLRSENLFFMNNRKIEWASHDQIVRGFSNKILKYGLGDPTDPKRFYENFSQEFCFENVWRTIAVLDKSASDDVLLSCGDDFKSSFVYNLQYDNRNSKLLPESGNMFKLLVECAPGFLNQRTRFMKYSFESMVALKILKKTFFNLSWRMGFLDNKSSYSNLMDKFYLGGPTDVRGFNYNSLGPRLVVGSSNKNFGSSQGDRLGGDLYYAAGLSLFTVVPKLSPTEDGNLKLHGFLNAGRVVNKMPSFTDMIKHPSVAAGVGLAYRYSAARFELNFTLPLTAHISDATRKGVQFGVGLLFL